MNLENTETFDVAIIGGGIVGSATLYKLQRRNPDLKIVLLEKEDRLAAHQTGHNSGVIHSGLYYKPGSLKAKNCVKGRHELVAFAKKYGVDHDVCGRWLSQRRSQNSLSWIRFLIMVLPTIPKELKRLAGKK